MATAVNTFETGLAAGTTITAANSGSGSAGDAFENVFGTGGVRTYENRAGGGQYARVGAGATSAQSVLEWTSKVGNTAPGGKVYGSAEMMVEALPVGNTARFAVVVNGTDGWIAQWHINTAGQLEQWTGGGTVLNVSTSTVTPGQWFKVHVTVLNISDTVGQLQCRLFLDPASIFPTETLTSVATVNLGAVDAAKYRFGLQRPMTNTFLGFDNIRWSNLSESPVGAEVVTGPIVGAMTSTGFRVSVETTQPAANHRLVISTSADLSSPIYSAAVTGNADGFAVLQATGLAPNTTYYYGLEVGGNLLPTQGRGQVTTDPTPGTAFSHSVAFGSCQWDETTAVTFDKIRAYSGPFGGVRRFNHLGDLHYLDPGAGTTRAQILAAHKRSLNTPVMRPALANLATTYEPDNHDYGGAGSDKNAPARADVTSLFRNVFPNYALPASDGVGMWFTYVLGRVRYIQIDNRSQRDAATAPNGPTKTMLGAEQKAWLKDLLAGPEPLKIILSGIYWRQDAPGSDRWGDYPDEFDELNDFIAATPQAQGKVYVLFGDRHALCADNGSAPETRGIPQAGGAPFQQGSVAPGETWSAGYYHDAPNTIQAFGILDVADDGTDFTLTYKGITSLDDTTRVTMTTIIEGPADQQLLPVGIASGAAAGAPTVTPGAVTVSPGGIGSARALGTPSVTPGAVSVAPAGIAGRAAAGTPTVTPGAVTVQPAGIASGASLGAPTVQSGAAPAQSVTGAGGIASRAAAGTPSVTPGAVTVAAQGIPSIRAVGTPTVTAEAGAQTVAPQGIPTISRVGHPTLAGGDLGQLVTVIGIPSAQSAGRPVVARMAVEEQEMAPCLWDVDTGCADDWAGFTPEVQSRATRWATEMLWMLSGRRFGTCPVTVRPCQGCAQQSWQTYGVLTQEGLGGSWVPFMMDGAWLNCGCTGGTHVCHPDNEVYLPGPVAAISEIQIDGQVVPADAYRVDDGNWLVRHDGGAWPRTQNLNRRPGAEDTFVVTYLRGTPVPDGGKIAAGALAVEFARACAGGGKCRLPREAQSIIRQGVELQLVSEDAADMLTGVTEADQWLRAVNPGKLRQRPQVASLDLTAPRVTTWG